MKRQYRCRSLILTSTRLRCTGTLVICANVLQWAPSRVTRRGALAATAAAAAAAFPPLPRYLPPPPVSSHTYARPLLPLDGPWSPRGPLGMPTSPTMGSHGRVASSLLLRQNTPSLVPFTPEQRNGRSPLSPFSLRFLSVSLFPPIAHSRTLSRYHFLSALSFACSRP